MHVSYEILIAQMASQKRVSIPFFFSIDLVVGGGCFELPLWHS